MKSEEEERYLIEEDEFEFPEIEEEEKPPKFEVKLTKALIKEITRLPTRGKILHFLYSHRQPYTVTQLEGKLNIDWMVIYWNLNKMEKIGLLRIVPLGGFNDKVKYYEIADRNAVKIILDRFDFLISFKLAKLLPYKDGVEISESQLKENTEFILLCSKFGITEDQGLDILESCVKKVGTRRVMYTSSYPPREERIFWRKEQ